MYDCISHLDSTSLLFAFRILQEQLHCVNQASVSPLWSEFHLLKHVPNTCMKTFVQEVKRIANSLHCGGRSLQPPRLGPGPRAVLQKLIDALIAIPEFNVEVARGQAMRLEQAQVITPLPDPGPVLVPPGFCCCCLPVSCSGAPKFSLRGPETGATCGARGMLF
jgi:hypothetical protein